MQLGVHLPQYGRAATAETIRRAAVQAEELGFHDLWVSDHSAIPAGSPYPPAFLVDPFQTLAYAAAVTTRIGLGTSALVLPLRHPLRTAKEIGSLDLLSDGRVRLAVTPGWFDGEFGAMGATFADRGERLEEAVAALRACWSAESSFTYVGKHLAYHDLKVLPKPKQCPPIWVGGSAPASVRRALRCGDGWQAPSLAPQDAAGLLRYVGFERPSGFTLSARVAWDGVDGDLSAMRKEADEFVELGFDHILVAPAQATLDGWLRSVELLWGALESFVA